MPLQLEIPDEYGYVLLAATSTFFLNSYHMLLTSKCRKESGIKYPTAYATTEQADKDPKAHRFNCAQRAHANFGENHPSLLGALLIAGLKFPVASAIAGAGWAVSRFLYAAGYTSAAGPQGRLRGAAGSALCDIALKFMALYASVTMVLGSA